MPRNIEVLSLILLALFSIALSGCVKQKEAQNKVVGFFISAGADPRSYSGNVNIEDFFAPNSGGKYMYTVVSPSQSVYTGYSSKAIATIDTARTMGFITATEASNLIPLIRELKLAFDLYQGLDEQGMVQGRFYSDKEAAYSAGVVMVIDTQTITDPTKIRDLAFNWLKKQFPPLFCQVCKEYNVGLRTDFYVLNDRWVVIIVATTDVSYNHLAKYAPGARKE